MSGPYPARVGPDPENISPVRVRVPLTLIFKVDKQKFLFEPFWGSFGSFWGFFGVF